jgi:hypothetical protein
MEDFIGKEKKSNQDCVMLMSNVNGYISIASMD